MSLTAPSGGVGDGENLIEALRREAAEETGPTVAAVRDCYLGHFDHRPGSRRAARQFDFSVTLADKAAPRPARPEAEGAHTHRWTLLSFTENAPLASRA
ncbi:NUDIX hydrolase [Streptomyces hesseae]|uniref:NUDIX hydrolase n=1 Tax=Streptomyces hesseae TaxID=3075519 RepID=A0ABU2SXY0_9ACTN|nr:NUDIX hydrolase [Streptomyces sp. DSM 40473]MDT0453816.1 NUDIX hydrolase [Streptomyces sp. DSM 40473]